MEKTELPFRLNSLYNFDCMEAMKKIPDKYFQLAIVDPPYGIGENGKSNKTRSCLAQSKDYIPYYGDDKKPPDIRYFNELFRVSENQIIFGANHFIDRISLNSSCWIVWDKENWENDFADCDGDAEIKDTPRYVALGNSLAVPCAERVFRGIVAVMERKNE